MVIVYESKTGFTKMYADILAKKTGLKSYRTNQLSEVNPNEEIIFLGWISAGRIKGLKKVHNFKIKAICPSGTGRDMENGGDTLRKMNHIQADIPLFYLRGGCLPLKDLKGMDKVMMSLFLRMLKGRKDKDEEIKEAIHNITNGFNGVKDENLNSLLEYLNLQSR